MTEKKYKTSLDSVKNNKIYLNIKQLDKGNYTVKIIHNNKVIKQIKFKK